METLTFTSAPATDIHRLAASRHIFCIMPATCHRLLQPCCPDITPQLLIPDSEDNKSLDTLQLIWQAMLKAGVTRHSLVVNIGGGVTTDMGGLAAALFMRGVSYVNVPTTLLAMVDASTGGKTAVNFAGIKNLIGAFYPPEATLIDTRFLLSLPREQLLSGFGEILKHALLDGDIDRILSLDIFSLTPAEWAPLISRSVTFKRKVVEADPLERGLRRVLNLGHTAGHAYEALAISNGRSVTHGCAVAQGLVTALVLSVISSGCPSTLLHRVASRVKELFPAVPFTCRDYPSLLSFMSHDKKNIEAGHLSFTLLKDAGKPVEACEVAHNQVEEAFDITRDLLGF